MKANISILFTEGKGQLNIQLNRDGEEIANGSLQTSGTIPLADVQSRDVITLDGVCTGSAELNIDVPTKAATPTTYPDGNFNDTIRIL